MNGTLIQLLVLAGVAIFLILKLRSVLGTRDGFEKPPIPIEELRPRVQRDFEVISGYWRCNNGTNSSFRASPSMAGSSGGLPV